MKKSMPFIYAALLAALSLVSCQKEEMLPEPDFQDSWSDELMTKAPAEEQTSGEAQVFSVSPTKKVFFTKGNLYWDGNDWKFESSQTDYPKKWDPSHVGHFYWTKTAAESRAEKRPDYYNWSRGDRFFADGSDPDHMLTVEDQSELYVLSSDEWSYLLSAAPIGRGAGDSYFRNDVRVNGVSGCFVIAPDGYSGKIASSYDAASWADAEASGLVCLPPTNFRDKSVIKSLSDKQLDGFYWSSTLIGKGLANCLFFFRKKLTPNFFSARTGGLSVRLVSTVPTGTAKATIDGKEVDVEWVQLWKDGPKFAVKNVGASVYTDKGSYMTYTEAVKSGNDYVWGSNWRTPRKDEMDLLNPHKVKRRFCKVDGTYGFMLTGVQRGYTGNSLFFPAKYGVLDLGRLKVDMSFVYYWSSTVNDSYSAWHLSMTYAKGQNSGSWNLSSTKDEFLVRPVLNE